MIYSMILIVVLIFVLNSFFDNYAKTKEIKQIQRQQQIDVLKIFSKQECFNNFSNNPEEFKVWISHFLELKGYWNININPIENRRDITACNKDGETVYIKCGLWKTEDWSKDIGEGEVQRLVGEMAADGIKEGLILTMSNIDTDARKFIDKVIQSGFKIESIDGEGIIKELYDLRLVKVKGLLSAFETN